MKSRTPSTIFHLALGFLVFGVPCAAIATLGEPASSVAKDCHALSATKGATTTHNNYTVEQMVAPSSTVREYVNASGMVFAVAWDGAAPPDLNTLLGAYAPEYKTARDRTPRTRGRRSLQVKSERIVVETWGQMRALHGRAYLPTSIPAGVTVDEIK